MSKLRIVYDNILDDATLSASPVMVSTLDEDNLKTACRSSISRTTSTAAQAIYGTYAASQLASCFTLWRHNLTADATVRLRLYSQASQGGSVVYDSTALEPYDTKMLGDLNWGIDVLEASVFTAWGVYWTTIWFPPVAFQSFRIDLTDASNPDGYMEITRAVLGAYIEPTLNPVYGMKLGWQEKVVQERTDGGTLHSDPTTAYRVMEFTLKDLDESSRPKFLEMTRVVGGRNDFFISMYPDIGGEKERDHSMVAKLDRSGALTHPYYASYTQSFKVLEV